MQTFRHRLRVVGLLRHASEIHQAAADGDLKSHITQLAGSGAWIPLALQPEPTNQNDPKAIMVVVPARFTVLRQDFKMGYIPRQSTGIVHELIDDCAANGHSLGCGLLISKWITQHGRDMWSIEIETTSSKSNLLDPSRRDQADDSDLFYNQMDPKGQMPKVTRPQRPRRGKVQHIWI
jgi:hypothetical protein